MPVWYVAVYTSTSRYENLIPVYTGTYLDVLNRLVLSRWSGFQMAAKQKRRLRIVFAVQVPCGTHMISSSIWHWLAATENK